MAELGGFDSSPVRIVTMETYALLLGTSNPGAVDLEVCEDGEAVRVVPHGKQAGHHGTSQKIDSPDRDREPLYHFSRALSGSTPGAALFLAEAPLRAWLLGGCHTSLVCFGIPPGPVPEAEARSPARAAPGPASPAARYRFSWDGAQAPAASAPTGLPATLELLMGLERSSVLLECLHAAFSGPAGESGLALWCFELHDGGIRGSSSTNGNGGRAHSRGGVGGSGASARRPPELGSTVHCGADGAGAGWRDLMAEAVAEVMMKASLDDGMGTGGVHSTHGTMSGGGGGAAARPFRSMNSLPVSHKSVAAAASAATAEGPVHAASVVEALAALHAAFCRSNLWRRRDPTAEVTATSSPGGISGGAGFTTPGRQGPLLEPAISPEGPIAGQLFVRLGVQLPASPHSEQSQSQLKGSAGRGLAAASASGVRRGEAAADRVWTTLDLAFVGCDPQTSQPAPFSPPQVSDGGLGADDGAPTIGLRPGGCALGPPGELLAELLSRQGVSDTGIPRPLRCTHHIHGSALCRRLAPLLAGNVAPHVLLALPAILAGPGGADSARRSCVLQAAKLVSEARAIRTVVTKTELPPQFFGVNTGGGAASSAGGGSSGSARALTSSLSGPLGAANAQKRERQIAAMLRMRHSQEMKDVAQAHRREAARAAAASAAPAASASSTSTSATDPPLLEPLQDSVEPDLGTAVLAEFARARYGYVTGGGAAAAGIRYSDGSGILARLEGRTAASASAAAMSSPAGAATGWRPAPEAAERSVDERPWNVLPAAVMASPAANSRGRGRTIAADDPTRHRMAPSVYTATAAAASPRDGQALDRDPGDQPHRRAASPRRGASASQVPSLMSDAYAAVQASGGSASSSFSSGGREPNNCGSDTAAVAGTVPGAAGRPQGDSSVGGGVLVGGMAKLQKRLEMLQKARLLREEAEAAAATAPVGAGVVVADRYHASEPWTGSQAGSSAVVYEESDSGRSAGASASAASGSGTCLYGSITSGGRTSGGAWLPGNARVSQGHASDSHGYQLSGRERLLQQQQQHYAHLLQQQQLLQELQQRDGMPRLPPTPAVAATSTAAAVAAAAATTGAAAVEAAAAASERLIRLRSEFERLYHGLVSEVLQDSAAAAASAAVAGRFGIADPLQAPPLAAAIGTVLQRQAPSPPKRRQPMRHSSPSKPSAQVWQALSSPASATAAGVTAARLGASGGGAGGRKPSAMPDATASNGDGRRTSPRAAVRRSSSSSSRRSSEVAWAALPHQSPAPGLYGALLAGYALQELPKMAAAPTTTATGPMPSSNPVTGASAAGGAAAGTSGNRRKAEEFRYDLGGGPDYGYTGRGIASDRGGSGGLLDDGRNAGGVSGSADGDGDDGALEPSMSGWPPDGKEGVQISRIEAKTAVAPDASIGGDVSLASPSRGLERLLDSSSSSGDEERYHDAQTEALDAGRAAEAVAPAPTGRAADRADRPMGLADAGWSSGTKADVEGGGTVEEALKGGGGPWKWSGHGDALDGDVSGIGEGSAASAHSGSEPGDGLDGDAASLGSWNHRIAQDAVAAAAALSSPPPAALQPLSQAADDEVDGPSQHVSPLAGSSTSTSTLLLHASAENAARPRHNSTVASGGGDGDAVHAGLRSGSSGPSSGAGVTRAASPETPGGPYVSTAAFVPPAAAAAVAATPPGSVSLRQRNQALLGALERAASGSEALHDKLYDTQLELLELRAAMEVQQASHDAEVARLRQQLRRAAVAAAAEEDGCDGEQPAGGGRGKASAALAALVGAYEEEVGLLQRQVADLVQGQHDLATRCAEQELAALALDVVRNRRRCQHQERRSSFSSAGGVALSTGAAASSAGGAGAEGRRGGVVAGAAAAAARAQASPMFEAAQAAGHGEPSSLSPWSGPKLRLSWGEPGYSLQPQHSRSRSTVRNGPPNPHRRRLSCGPVLSAGRNASSPPGCVAAAAVRRRGGFVFQTSSPAQIVRVIGLGGSASGGEGGAGSGWSDGDDDKYEYDCRKGVWDGHGTLGGVSSFGPATMEEAQASWHRGRREMSALRSALRQANRREAQLRSALAAAQQQRRAALLEARVAAGEGVRRRWLEAQYADLTNQLVAARLAASTVAAERDTAARAGARLHAENQVLAGQAEELRRLAEGYALQMQMMQVDMAAAAAAGRGLRSAGGPGAEVA